MRIIDCDSHFITPEIFDHIPIEFSKYLPNIIFNEQGGVADVTFDVDPINHPSINKPADIFSKLSGNSNMAERFNDLKKMKVDFQLLGPQERAMRFSYAVEKNLAAGMAHSYNILLKKIISQYPDKFLGVALLPLQDIDLALKELDWIIENKFKVIYLHLASYDQETKMNTPWSEVDQINKIYEICEKNNIVIMFHGLMQEQELIKFSVSDKIKIVTQNKKIYLGQMSVIDILLDDVFDRFPSLQIIFAEPANRQMHLVLKDLDIAYNSNPSLFKGKKHFIKYLKENISFAIDIEMKDHVDALIKYIGSERLLFSTDYPHNDIAGKNKWKDADDLYAYGLSQEDMENIAFRNAEKLFQLS